MTTAYTASNTLPMGALPTTNGIIQKFFAASSNLADATYSPDGLVAAPIYGLGGNQLQGNEIVSGGIVTLVSYVGPLLNSGALCWLLMECDGGAQQVGPAIQSEQAAQLQQIGHGQCRISVASATSLLMKPYNGQNIIINGVPQRIPNAGITFSNSGLSASTTYYVYAFTNLGVMTLELSTTGHTLGSNGVEIKSGDATRTLVGMICTNSSSQFADSITQRFCLNWFNRRTLTGKVALSNVSISSPTAIEISPSARLAFLTWGDEGIYAGCDGEYTSSSSNTSIGAQEFIDASPAGVAAGSQIDVAGHGLCFSSTAADNYSEGLHTASVYAMAPTSTVTIVQVLHKIMIQG